MQPNPGTIGRRLAAIRGHRLISQAELARAVGVTKALIGHYEHGRAEIGASRLEQLATALHCKAADILAALDAPLPRIRFRGGPPLETVILSMKPPLEIGVD